MNRPLVWLAKPLDDDELTLEAMARKYGVTAKTIAEANDVEWSKEAINDWVMEAGGRMLSSGWAVFQPGNMILLPVPAEPIQTPLSQQQKSKSNIALYLVGGTVAGLALLSMKRKR